MIHYDISDYGASPGSPDNSSPIQDAIDAAGAAGAGLVLVPVGVFVTTSRHLLPNVTMVGVCPICSVLKLKDGTNDPILSTGSAPNCGARNLGWDGNNANQDAGSAQIVLAFHNCDDAQIENIRINRGTDGTKGIFGTTAGLYVAGGSGQRIRDVKVTGNGMGAGIVITAATNFELVSPHVHDMAYALASSPGDDRIEGLRLQGCSDFTLVNPRVHDMGGNYGAGATTRYSRGIVYGGCSDFTVHNPRAWKVDQGHDMTGSDGNVRFEITGGLMRDCYTWGWKFANSARDGSLTGAVAERCGIAGFVAQGPSEAGLAVKTSDIQLNECTAYDIGAGGVWAGNEVIAGFRMMNHNFDQNTTRGIRLNGCRAIDRQASRTMEYGVHNGVDSSAASDGRYNEAPGFVSIGHTVAASFGLHEPRCTVRRTVTQSIPTNAWTVVDWNADTDLGAMHDTVSNNDQLHPRRSGQWRLDAGVVFAANATGRRGVRLSDNGNPILGSSVVVGATPIGNTSLTTTVSRHFEVAAGGTPRNLRVEVFQDSGGNLNLQTNSEALLEQVP